MNTQHNNKGSLPERVKDLYFNDGLTQCAIAQTLGIAQSVVSPLLSGIARPRCKAPGCGKVLRIDNQYGYCVAHRGMAAHRKGNRHVAHGGSRKRKKYTQYHLDQAAIALVQLAAIPKTKTT